MSATAAGPPATPRTTRSPIACPACGKEIAPDQSWCLQCGAAARTRIARLPRWRTATVAVAIAVALAIAGLVYALVKLSSDTGTVTTTPTITQTVPAAAPPAAAPSGVTGATGATGATGPATAPKK